VIERTVAPGWKLVAWSDWFGKAEPHPSLDGGECGVEVDGDGNLVVTDDRRDHEKGRVHVPRKAMNALLREWLNWKARRRGEEACQA
jgi:hypothetical protein